MKYISYVLTYFILGFIVGLMVNHSIRTKQETELKRLKQVIRHEGWLLDGAYYVDAPDGSRWALDKKNNWNLVWRGK